MGTQILVGRDSVSGYSSPLCRRFGLGREVSPVSFVVSEGVSCP